ncbi:hypothetical protein G9A89_016697 [Geosiphon pyriformis]|nr:hypothetical protein G9A89_016697 [Geosiphon pyriformis]
MNKLAINTSELTRKKKKAKVDFILNPNKTFKSTVDNNKPPKTKVFKNPPKLEPPEIVQKSGPYFVVKNLMKTPVHITFGQKDLHKSLIPKKKTPKTNKHSCQAKLADNSNVTFLICKAQVADYFIDLILNSRSSVSIIAKHFLETIGRKIDKPSTKPITNVHAIPVQINGISIETDMEVSEAKEYIIIVGNKWLKKAKALLNYKLCELTIRCDEKPIVVKCHYWTIPSIFKQNQEKKQSDKSDDNKKNLARKQNTIIDGMVLVPGVGSCLIYYKDWEPISLILKEKLKKVQKFFKSEPLKIQSLVVKQREPSSEERKVDIKNLLARNSPVISKEGDTPG